MDVVLSPQLQDVTNIPKISIADYILEKVQNNLDKLGCKPWLVDVTSGNVVKFCDIEVQSRRLASALARRGFKKGDLMYFVTYEMAYVFLLHVAVWRLGGTMRGWYQAEELAEYKRQISDTRPDFVLVDAETAPRLRDACQDVEWPMQWFSIGNFEVPNTTPVELLLQDDGSAFPPQVEINPCDDVIVIPSTSGSTGNPKGVLHTHYTMIAANHARRAFFSSGDSVMSSMVNFSGANLMLTLNSATEGYTVYYIGKFRKDNYFDLLLKYKPENIIMYPFLASWFARSSELDLLDLSFLRAMGMAAWILDPSTVALLASRLPHVHLVQSYGMTECMIISSTDLRKDLDKPLVIAENEGEQCVSTGRLFPYFKAKVVDTETGKLVERGERGEIMVHSPSIMLGYLNPGNAPNRSDMDSEGWLHTGDMGFIDRDGNVFVIERLNFMYKYQTVPVCPSEIEAVLQEHPSVLGAGVVGVPNPETDNLSRAYVVLRPGSTTTNEELQEFAAQRLSVYKRLHGGVRFLDKLPESKGGKLDRAALKKIALQELKERNQNNK